MYLGDGPAGTLVMVRYFLGVKWDSRGRREERFRGLSVMMRGAGAAWGGGPFRGVPGPKGALGGVEGVVARLACASFHSTLSMSRQ